MERDVHTLTDLLQIIEGAKLLGLRGVTVTSTLQRGPSRGGDYVASQTTYHVELEPTAETRRVAS